MNYIDPVNYSKQIKSLLVEMEVAPDDPLADQVRQFADLVQQIDSLKAQLKHLEDQYPQLEAPIYKILEDLQTVDTDVNKSIKVGNELIVTFARKPYEQTKVKYKEAFEYLYGKVNGAIKRLADEAKEATASISKVKGSVKVTKLEAAKSPIDFNTISQEFSTSVDSLDSDFQKLFASAAKYTGGIKEDNAGHEPFAGFYEKAIESASGDKISHTEEDDYGRTIYWSTKNPNVNYYIGDNHSIIKYDAKTGKHISIGNINDYDEPISNDRVYEMDQTKMATHKGHLSKLTPDEQTQLKEYIDSIKEIKKEISKLMAKAKSGISEQGGNKSSGLTLKTEEGKPEVKWNWHNASYDDATYADGKKTHVIGSVDGKDTKGDYYTAKFKAKMVGGEPDMNSAELYDVVNTDTEN